MSTYHYPYQRILDVKSKEKENAQLQMAKAIQRQSQAEIRINELEQKIGQATDRVEQQYVAVTRVQDLQGIENYMSVLRKKLSFEKKEVEFAKKNVDKKQEVLREKLKEEKTWMVLREKKENEHLEGLKHIEQQELDEMASTSFNRLSESKG
ncbi:flagellar export protein FliJ [Bacillus horti]|uniref:Flagellar FliJ protein n=1 Tax=Caldalkalibacillus horti TaxID=77523 RepID=A0ABT9VUK6_9BACI|nr:flagellar export protein FliJ [Bacillus horti]MDQ0164664.1 flagellar FliJ protein [Bacillus horti]